MRLSVILMILLVISIVPGYATQLDLIYDANGNKVSGDGFYRTYNSLNQLWKVYNGTSISDPLLQEFTYDPVEERVLIKDTYWPNSTLRESVYYVTPYKVIVVNASGTFETEYIYHNGQLVAQKNPDGSFYFILSDHLGSSSIITNSSGDVVERSTYSPYGELLTGGASVRYGYEAKEQDTLTGETNFNFRMYNPEYALFSKPDDIIQNVYDPQMLNRYSFERNNPYLHTDPTGHFLPAIFAAVVVAGLVSGVVYNVLNPREKIEEIACVEPEQLHNEKLKYSSKAVGNAIIDGTAAGVLSGVTFVGKAYRYIAPSIAKVFGTSAAQSVAHQAIDNQKISLTTTVQDTFISASTNRLFSPAVKSGTFTSVRVTSSTAYEITGTAVASETIEGVASIAIKRYSSYSSSVNQKGKCGVNMSC